MGERLSKRVYWATVADAFYRLVFFFGGLSLFSRVLYRHLSERVGFALVFLTVCFLIGALCEAARLYKAISKWRKTNASFVLILYELNLERRRTALEYQERPQAKGKSRTFLAWLYPGFFGGLALLMALLSPFMLFDKWRQHPVQDFFCFFSIPGSILMLITILLWRQKRNASRKGISLTDELYEWYRQYFEVGRARSKQKTHVRSSMSQKLIRGGAIVLISFALICFDVTGRFADRFHLRQVGDFTIFDMLPWLCLFEGVRSIIGAFIFGDE